ncbi:hypothetical protein EDB81DRAFT_862034 [Dactylonectria macrodidyma]|uniref:Nephrocystin 3-like N-terminal domain-containing protein n=1 Tax=Dactylonectria macrodidyma TaxID=307937 RepID=A0A9P9DDM4_9HYPO|nr:hypothetical protein EDB81DRAFT_862034 [Dactylonectria macrodidyma]
MVIDMSHGLALCYSICLLCMQDKLEGLPRGLGQQEELRDAMRKAVPALGVEQSDQDMDALVEMTPDVTSGSENQPITHGGKSFNLKRRASFGKSLPVETLLSALQILPEGCHSADDLWALMTSKLESAIQDANQPPIQLPTVEDARYNSEDVQGNAKCHKGTRTGVLSRIHSWVDDTAAETIFWLYAPAGTGKSTLARTLADDLSTAEKLAAGYFFKRGDVVRNDTARIFPTIASQLIETIPHFKHYLRRSLESSSESVIEKRALEDQFKTLIQTPLSELLPFKPGNSTKVIIIDALDECDRPEHIPRLLKLFSSLGGLCALRLCVFFTSRFAPPIVGAFGSIQQAGTLCRTLALHEEFYEETKTEIEVVLKDSLAEIKEKRKIKREPWPKPEELGYVVSQATTPSPLFIYAATLLRFIDDEKGQKNPVKKFGIWLNQCRRNVSQLDQMYMPILEALLDGDAETGSSETLASEERSELLDILGSLILLARPLPVGALADLLDMDEDDVSHWLRNLHAVLHVPIHDEYPVEIIHKSFSDFLLGDGALGTDSFRCDIQHETIALCIPVDLEYACLYWVHHLLGSKMDVDEDEIYPFLKEHFLHWLEALSIVGKLPDGGVAIRQLLTVIALSQESQLRVSSPLSELLKDAERFVLEYGSMIEKNPLQAYGSALVLSPSGSRVRQLFVDTNLACVQNVKGGPTDWDPHLQTFTAGDEFKAFAISQDGQMMAVATLSTLGLWDVGTGIFQQEFTETGHICALSFLEDGKHLASVTEKGELQLWDMVTGIASTQCTFMGCGDLQNAAILPGHSLVATVACDFAYAVDLWDFKTGARRLTQKHDTDVKDVAFSLDGSTVASVLRGRSIQLWSTETSRVRCKTLEAPELTNAVAFSPNGSVLASASPGDICLWDVTTGIRQHTLRSEGLGYPESIAFFPAGDMLAVCERVSVTIWDIPTWINQQAHQQAHPPIGSNVFDPKRFPHNVMTTTRHEPIDDPGFMEALALSPDQKTLASSSWRHPLLLWDIERGTLQHNLPNPNWLIQKMAFSPDGKTLAAASYESYHKELRLELHEVTAGSLLWRHEYSADGIVTIAFSPDGKTLAVVSEQRVNPWKVGRVQLWDVAATGTPQWHQDSTGGVQVIAFSPDGKTLAVASGRAVKLWEVATRTVQGEIDCTPRLPKPFLGLSRMIFSRNGKILEIAPYFEDRVLLWHVVTDHVRALDANSEEYFKLMLPDARMSVRVPWINYASKAILQIPSKYENYKTTSSGSRVVMGKVDGEFIVLDFDLARLNDI